MSSAFDDLFSTFKGGNQSSQNGIAKAKSPRIETSPGINYSDDSRNGTDLDEIFGFGKQANSAPAVKDEFDLAFDAFDAPAKLPQNHVDPEPQPLVDEVKDMEIARLMSLGLSCTKATSYYERGLLYDDLLERKRQQRTREEAPQKTSDEGRFTQGSEPDLLSVASSWLNRGRTFLDSKLKQIQNDNGTQSYSDYISSRTESSAHTGSRLRPTSDNPTNIDQSISFQDLSLADQPNESSVPAQVSPMNSEILPPLVNIGDDVPVSGPEEASADLLVDFDAPSGHDAVTTPVAASIEMSALEFHSYQEFKEKGTLSFSAGDYHTAFQNFEKSVNSLPHLHPLRAISLSNMIICRLKLGEYRKAIEDSSVALKLISCAKLDDVIPASDPPKTFKEIWCKIVGNKAEAYEHIEDYDKALKEYQLLVKRGAASRKVMEGRRRCQKIVEPEKFVQRSKTPLSTSPSVSRKDVAVAATSQVPSEKLERVQNINKKEKELERQKFLLHDKVQDRVREWCQNSEDDLRELLSRFHLIVDWVDWKNVSTADLVMPKRVKIVYLKAVAKTHPDKIQDSWPLERKMVAENVFVILSKAWELFKEQNKLS